MLPVLPEEHDFTQASLRLLPAPKDKARRAGQINSASERAHLAVTHLQLWQPPWIDWPLLSSAATDHQPSEAAAERSLGPYRLPLATAVLSGSAVRPAASTARASFGLRMHKLLLKEKAPADSGFFCRSARSKNARPAVPAQVLDPAV